MNKIAKLALATSAAALFSTAVVSPAVAGDTTETSTVKCHGINSCKGASKCLSATNACKGQNECKGKGWLRTTTAMECLDRGGKVIK